MVKTVVQAKAHQEFRLGPWGEQATTVGEIVAAVRRRACNAEVGDPNRSPRTLTVHYLGPPAEGPAEVEVGITVTTGREPDGGPADPACGV